MLSWLHKLWTKLNRSPPTTLSKMADTEVRMGDIDNPSSVWIPSSAMLGRPHLDRHQSFRRQLSRKLSSRAKQLSTCNATACTIAVCFIVAFCALIVSCFTFYLYVQRHGLGPEMSIFQETLNPHSSGWKGASLPPQVSEGVATAMPPQSEQTEDEGAAKAYAHIVGSGIGPRGNDGDLECLTSWKANATHNVNFLNHYAIEIIEPGYYYVYSQIYFSDSEDGATIDDTSQQPLPMRSSTNRNHVPLMESMIPFKEYATKYHGGVFHLSKGDKITVSVSDNDLRINTGSDKTFFGVFMLGSTVAGHGAAAS